MCDYLKFSMEGVEPVPPSTGLWLATKRITALPTLHIGGGWRYRAPANEWSPGVQALFAASAAPSDY